MNVCLCLVDRPLSCTIKNVRPEDRNVCGHVTEWARIVYVERPKAIMALLVMPPKCIRVPVSCRRNLLIN